MAVDFDAIAKKLEQEASEEGASVFARASANLGPAAPESAAPESSLAQEFNLGMAQILGLPGDVMAGINRAATKITGIDFGGEVPFIPTSRDIQQAAGQDFTIGGERFESIVPAPGEEGDDLASRAVRFVGSGVVPTGGVLFAGGRLLRSGQLARRTAGEAGEVAARQATQSTGSVARAGRGAAAETAKRPVTTVAGEATAATTAAGGGRIGEETFPEHRETARAIGELIGGGGLAAGPMLAKKSGPIVEGVASVTVPFGGTAARWIRSLGPKASEAFSAGRRSRRRIDEMTDDPQRAVEDISAGEGPAMERTGEEGLMQLERTVMKNNPEIARRIVEQRRAAREGLEEQARMGGAREAARGFIEKRTTTAIRDLERKIERLRPNADPEQASTAARQELEKALQDIRRRENALWNDVPGDSTLVPTSAREEMEDVLTTENAPDLVPGWLRKKVGSVVEDEAGNEIFKPGSLGDDATLEQVKTTRSQVLKAIRSDQRGETDFNRVRILRRIDEALLDDMERAGGEAVRKALALSREKNRIFRGGALGKVLKFSNRIEPEQTLEATIGVRGQQPAVNFRRLMEGAEQADDPQAARRLKSQVEEFLKDAFVVQAVNPDSGQISTGNAQRFLNNRRPLLKEFPELEKQLRNARSRQKMVNERLGTVKQEITPIQRQKAATALFLGGQPGQEMDALLDVGDPRSALTALVRETRQDRSGQAFKGLKATFVETLMDRARTDRAGETGDRFVRGSKFLEQLGTLGPAARDAGLMTEAELGRLRLIGEKFRRFERAEGSRSAGGITSEDNMISTMLERGVQVLGAVGGRALNTGTIQAPGIAAGQAQRLKQALTTDRAEAMLVRFVQDPNFARALLMDLDGADPKQLRDLERRLGTTLGAAAPATEEREGE